jgi:hypothetical protein
MQNEVIQKQSSAVAEYVPFYAQLAELEKNNSALVFDYEDKKGNKEARSHVYALRQTKAALEKTRKAAKEESLKYGRLVDSEAKEIEKRIEDMIAVHQTKLDEIEQRETDRINAIKLRLETFASVAQNLTAAQYRDYIALLEAIAIDDSWQEFVADAAKAKDASMATAKALLAEAEKKEAEQAELERLRREAAEREQRDREAAIAKAAAEKATREAEEKAARESAEAEAKAKQEREDAERRELELKLAAENAERRRIEAEKKAADDAKAALAKAEADRIKAIEDEKARVAAEKKAEEDAAAKREANKAHQKKINNEALAAFVQNGLTEEQGKLAISLIASGKVPNIRIVY